MKRSPNTLAGFFRAAGAHGGWWALAVLLAGLSLTAFLAHHQKQDADAEARREFDFICSEIQSRVESRVREHEQILQSGAAFFRTKTGSRGRNGTIFSST